MEAGTDSRHRAPRHLWNWGHQTRVPRAGELAQSLCLKPSDPCNLLSPTSLVTAYILCEATLDSETPQVAEGRGAALKTGE